MVLRTSILCLFIVLVSCKDSEKENISESKKAEKFVYDMYEPSEMANLMNAMYSYNLKVKQAIVNGEELHEFPIEFLKIHSAELSEFKTRNKSFESFSKLFIQAEKDLYNPDLQRSQTERFNTAINVCISCHQVACTGPIPRIKKLLIH